ncbi:MAG: hypothetical protein WC856_06330 [Methylococcaceae bacterium]|jgi:hypothetical protein
MSSLLYQKMLLIIFLGFSFSTGVVAQDWNSNPNNWKNNQNNWENNQNNWKNSPNNWENSPNRWGNERIIRDSDGNSAGYAVPKQGGGVNFYDNQGNRRGYLPPSQ